jgi:hypothetical protein
MYVEILTVALEAQDHEASDPAELHRIAIDQRDRAGRAADSGDGTVESQLAFDVAYDRALINLCHSVGIDTEVTQFSRPRVERLRLENALAETEWDVRDLGSPRRLHSV